MKRKNRILPLALAGAMAVGCLTGCGGASSDSTGGNAESGAEQGATSEVASTEAEPVQATYPLADGDKTITVYMRDATSGAAGDWNNIKGFQKAEEILGVDIEFIMPAVGSEADQFNLMIASGEYPDIIMWDFNSTPMTLDQMVDSGILLDMDSYIRQYAPNYLALLETNEEYKLEGTADNGHMLAMYGFNQNLPISGGPAIRADLLEKYNLETPVTVDDWTNVMTTIKEQDPTVEYPLTTGKNRDGSVWFDMLLPAYKTAQGFCLDDETGEVVYGPATDNFKEYLTKLNEWYNAGLIDPEFMSNDGTSMNAKLTDGRSIAGSLQLNYHILNITSAARETNPDFTFEGATWPVLNEGDRPSFPMADGVYYSGGQAAITSACEDPVLATQFIDFFYSEEGQLLLGWGIEGESYTVNDDGTKQYTDTIMNNPDGKTPAQAILEFSIPMYGFCNQIREDSYVPMVTTLPEQAVARERWLDADWGVNIPRLNVAADVQSDYTMLMNDITTYVQEMYIQFITGQASLDTDWESYVNGLNGMGLETATQYMADAYALYQQR